MNGCKTCGKPLCRANRTGWCRQHYGSANNGERCSLNNRARWDDPVQRERVVIGLRSAAAKKVAWCPLEYRAEYRRLKRTKHYSAAAARKFIEEMVAADLRRYLRTGRLPQAERLAA